MYLQSSIADYLWQFFSVHQLTDAVRAIESLNLLCIVLEVDPRYIYDHIDKFKDSLLRIFKQSPEDINWQVVARLTKAFHFLRDFKQLATQKIKGMRNLFLKGLLKMVFVHQGTKSPAYSQALEKIIHLAFLYRTNPESICEFIIKNMSKFLSKDAPADLPRETRVLKLVHLLEAVGHITLKFLMFYDLTIANLEKIKNDQIEAGTSSLNQNSADVSNTIQSKNIPTFSQNKNTENEQELEKAFGGAEAEFEIKKQALQTIINKGFLGDNLLNEFLLRVTQMIQPYLDRESRWDSFHPETYVPGSSSGDKEATSVKGLEAEPAPLVESDLELRIYQTCVDCLCNFMILSPLICDEYLHIFFKLLEAKSTPSSIKNNLLVTMGDLIRRHSTILTEKKGLIFRNLRIKDDDLRRTAVIILSQLVLNDYLKLRGEVIDFVLLLNDSNVKIRSTLNAFFQELRKKDPKIFSNMIPDAINRFSVLQSRSQGVPEEEKQSKAILPEEREGVVEGQDLGDLLEKNQKVYDNLYEQDRLHELFTKFLRFILDFIDKDKVGPMLVEKLCNKLKFNKNRLEVLNIFRCFYFFVSNDSAVLKLLENGSVLKEKMDSGPIREIMTTLINTKLKKSAKVNKATLDDLEKLVHLREKTPDDSPSSQITMNSKSKRKKSKIKR